MTDCWTAPVSEEGADRVFRRATAAERELLDEMTLAGVRFWGHHVNYPDVYQSLAKTLSEEPGPENFSVFVLEEDGEVIGFFELRDRGDHAELLRMFLRTDRVGKGYGKRLWNEAVAVASETHDRLLIMSDPAARGFYEAMGAGLETEIEVDRGFSLGKYWFELPLLSDTQRKIET